MGRCWEHDWFLAEMTYVTSFVQTVSSREKTSFIKVFSKLDNEFMASGELEMLARQYINIIKPVTLKTISEMYGIPYQSVRRYAAKHNWRKKRLEFRSEIQRKIAEKQENQTHKKSP
jgi:alanyl-tRNA synthetase